MFRPLHWPSSGW